MTEINNRYFNISVNGVKKRQKSKWRRNNRRNALLTEAWLINLYRSGWPAGNEMT